MNSLKALRMQYRWDRQIAADVSSGKLDRLLQRVNADIEANRIKPLDEILFCVISKRE